MDELQILKRRLAREQLARKQAEAILEQKALELHKANEDLIRLNESLEQKIEERTADLERSEKRYRQIIERANDFIFRADPDGYFTYVNPVVSKKLGYTSEQIIGSHFTEYVLPGYEDTFMNLYIKYRDEQKLNTYQELPIVTKDGDILWIGQNVQLILQDGVVKEATGVARDITERKIAEDTLQTTQSRLTSLITNLHSGVLVEDEYRKVVLANKRFCKLLKIPATPQELEGTDCKLSAIRSKHLFKTPNEFVDRVEALVNKKEMVVGEEIHMADGKILERDYIPIYNGNKYLGHLWQYQDITEEYLAEEKLRQSEEKYRGIIENMEFGLMEVDLDQNIVKVYDWFCDMTGYTAEELVGKNAKEVFLPEVFHEEMIRQNQNRAEGQAGVYEVQIKKKDGTLIWVLISGAPIFDQEGNITGSVGIHYDVTHQKNLQHDLEEAKRIAEEAEQAEQQFLARMSHEIRTPLNAIIGMSHLLDDTSLSVEQKDYVESLKSSSDILQKLISDILDLSKISAGGLEVHQRDFDLVGTVRSLQKTFALKIEASLVRLETKIDERIKTMMIGDDLLLNQILLNLIGNAIKFTKEGLIQISVSIVEEKPETSLIEFRVSDTGIGIPENRLEAIFDNFKQADNEIRFNFGGTGLGLPIAKQLVELQGGTIRVESTVGVGTHFIFRLPYQKGDQRIDMANPLEKIVEVPIEQRNILIAEDNFMNRKYIAALLTKWDLKYEFAVNGKEAVAVANQRPFDLIFMDISMPEMNGYDATIKIRNASKWNRQTPIVALTASAMLSKKDKAYEVGMTGYLAKPFNPHQLKEVIKEYSQSAHNEQSNDAKISDEFVYHAELDREHLAYLYKGDMDYASEMFALFMTYTMVEYDTLKVLLEQDEVGKLQHLAHKIKPNFSLVGLTSIEKQLLKLEKAALEGEPKAELVRIFTTVDEAVQYFKPIIAEQLIKIKNQRSKTQDV